MRISFVKAVGAGPERASLFFPSVFPSLFPSLFRSLWFSLFLASYGAAQMFGSFCAGQLLLDFQAINKQR